MSTEQEMPSALRPLDPPKVKRHDPRVKHRFDVVGTYAAYGDDGTREKPFRVTGVEMDDETVKKDGALSTFLKVLAPDVMPLLYKDYAGRCITHMVENATSFVMNAPTPIPLDVTLLDRGQALAFIQEYNLAVDASVYPEIGQLQQAIQDNLDDEDAFKRQQKLKKERMQAGPNLDKVRNLNKDLLSKQQDQVQLNFTPENKKGSKAVDKLPI